MEANNENKLYNLVKEILATSSQEEAKQKLFGLDGVDIKSQEYYERIISQFIRKKDLIIGKRSRAITYNLDSDIKDIWDIVFIYQYIINQWDKEIEQIEDDLKKLAEIKKTRDMQLSEREQLDEQIRKLNDKKDLIQSYSSADKLNISNINLLGIDNINQNQLQNEIENLKKAIAVFHKVRNSFEHRNQNLIVGKTVEINEPSFGLVANIPIEYIDNFNKGRIIVKDEDKELIERINNITFPILKSKNYDPKELSSFFYNVDPTTLSKILYYCNNDIHELYKIDESYFYMEEHELDYYFELEYNYAKRGYFKISQLLGCKNDCYIYGQDGHFNLVEYIEQNKISPDMLKLLSYVYSDQLEEILDIMRENNVVLEKLFNEDNIFYIKGKTQEILKTLKLFELTNIDLKYICKIKDFSNPQKIIDTIIYLNQTNKEINYDIVFDIYEAIESSEINSSLLDYVMNYCKKYNKSNSFAIKMYDNLSKNEYYETFIEQLKTNNFSKEDFDNLIETNSLIFAKPELFKNIINQNVSSNLNSKQIANLANISKKDNFDLSLIMQTLKKYNLELDDNNIITGSLINNYTETVNMLDLLSYYFETNVLKEMPDILFNDVDSDLVIINALKKNNMDINQFIDIYNSEYNKKDGISHSFIANITTEYSCEELSAIFEEMNKVGIPLETLLTLPVWTVAPELLQLTKLVYESCSDINKVPYYVFISCSLEKSRSAYNYNVYSKYATGYDNIRRIIDFFDYKGIEIDLSYMTWKVYNNYINFDTLSKLLDKVDNDYKRLDEFPLELFQCQPEILDALFENYNTNVCKSIFGIDNPKIIATLVYANSTLSKLNIVQNSDYSFDFELLNDIDSNLLIQSAYTETMQYMDNEDYSFTEINYRDQFKGNTPIQRTRHIYKKLRNACAHFRFKVVSDENGNIDENKIFLYDEDNNGTRNFNIVIKLNDLVELVNEFDKAYNLQYASELDSPQRTR